MRQTLKIALFAAAVGAVTPTLAQHTPHAGAQPYAGQNTRAITTLSADDVEALKAGRGWGLAKPAELNGYPGPMHVLELEQQLALTPAQKSKVQAAFERMQKRAIAMGPVYIVAESQLDAAFRSAKIDSPTLARRLQATERARAKLRAIHLEAHLETTPILSADQRKKYAELRGYGADPTTHHQHGIQKH